MKKVLAFVVTLAIFFSFVLAALIYLDGLLDIARGACGLLLYEYYPQNWVGSQWIKHQSRQELSLILNGLELLFLAPAVGLTFASTIFFLSNKLECLQNRLRHIAANPEDQFEREMHDIKFLVTGLMVSVLLTDLIGRVISDQELTSLRLFASASGITLTICYLAFQRYVQR